MSSRWSYRLRWACEPFRLCSATTADAITSDKKAFRHLWNGLDNAYNDSDTADLNLLIVHVFGAAYAVTKDKYWLDIGDKIADSGIAAMYVEAEAVEPRRPIVW